MGTLETVPIRTLRDGQAFVLPQEWGQPFATVYLYDRCVLPGLIQSQVCRIAQPLGDGDPLYLSDDTPVIPVKIIQVAYEALTAKLDPAVGKLLDKTGQ